MQTLFVRLVVVFGVAGLLAGCGGGGQTDSCDAGCAAAGTGGASGRGGAGSGTGGHSGTGGRSGAGGGVTGVGGGTGGPCTGTPTSSCAATNCDLLPGCSATTAAAGCTGTPTPCSASDNQSSVCDAELGCGVPTDAGLCTSFYTACGDPEIGNDLTLCNSITGCQFISGLCQGTIIDCSTITSAATCSGMSACNWTPAKAVYCEGIPVACQDVPRSGCAAQAGCHLTTAVCTGTPTACADLPPAMCASQPGCVGGTAGGTGGTGGTTPVKLPDLVVQSMVAEKATNQGQDVFHFGLVETNRGVVDAAPHSIAVVLSADNVIGNQDDVHLWTLTTTGPMAPFGIGTATWPAAYYLMTELVAAVPSSGYYYAGVVLDSKNEVAESEETNNTAVSTTHLFIGTPAYDLRAVAVSTDATSPLMPGAAMTVSVTVLNQSNIEVTSVPIDVLLSSDAVIDAADLRFCSTTASMTLAAGAQAVIPLSCTAPRLRGAYHLGAELDPANVLAESDETNNSVLAAGTLTLTSPSPDLTAAAVMTDITDVPWSGNVTFSADARNGGVDPAGAFNVGFYLSANAVLDTADDLVCQVSVPGLAAGAQTHVTKSCAIPALDSGSWRVIAKADSQDTVFETDETNNTAVAPDTITVAQPTWDLASGVFSDDGGSTLSVGQTLNFQIQVTNSGSDPIPGFDADVVLSTDMSITTSDHLLCTVTLGSVPAQSEAGFPFSCQIPDTPAGSYYTGIILDPRNDLTETNEDNNTSVDTVPRAIAP